MTEPARKLDYAERDACVYCGEPRGLRKGLCQRCRDDRDMLAAAAMRAVLGRWSTLPVMEADRVADESYAMADAMMRRRER